MFLTDHKLPLGEQIAGFVDWLTLHGASFFDKISDTLGSSSMASPTACSGSTRWC